MARNPKAQRPRVPGWPRVDKITVGVSLFERWLLRGYAEREGLAVGAAARELMFVGLILEADAHPDASRFGEVRARVRAQEIAGSAEIEKINAAFGIEPTEH